MLKEGVVFYFAVHEAVKKTVTAVTLTPVLPEKFRPPDPDFLSTITEVHKFDLAHVADAFVVITAYIVMLVTLMTS